MVRQRNAKDPVEMLISKTPTYLIRRTVSRLSKDMSKIEKNYAPWLLASTFLCCFGSSFLFGYNIAVLNTPAKIIQSFYNETYTERRDGDPLDEDVILLFWSSTVSAYVAFGMIGAFVSGMVADRLGRKRGLIFNHIFMFIGAILEGIAYDCDAPELLFIGRGFVGVNCGMTVGLASLYLTEISAKETRGALGACHQLATVIGILTAQIFGLHQLLGTEYLWPVLVGFSGIPALVSFILFPLCPESPRYLLLKKNDNEGALSALKRLRGTDDVQDEMEEMLAEGKQTSPSESGSYTIGKLLTTPELRMPLLIAVVLQIAQQWSGINAVFFYSEAIFMEAGIKQGYIQYAIVGTGVVNVVATIIALPLVEKLGRRVLLIWPLVLMAGAMGVLTISLNLLEQHRWLSYVCVVCLLVYVIGFALGLGPIPAMIVSELFRQEPRPAAMAISQFVNWMCNFILALLFPFIQKGIGAYSFLIFVAVIAGSGVFLFFFVPETKNKTFEEIAQSIAFGTQYMEQPQSILLEEAEQNNQIIDEIVEEQKSSDDGAKKAEDVEVRIESEEKQPLKSADPEA